MKSTTHILSISFLANLSLSILKIIGGILGTSQSLIADGLHSFSDLATDVVAIIGNKFAKRPADREHPFGHGKLEYITSMFIAIAILGVGFSLIKTSIFSSIEIPDKKVLIIVFVTIIMKTIVANYLLKSGKKMRNQILISSGKESFTDVTSSILVFVVIILSQFQSQVPFLAYVDKIGGIIIGIMILITGIFLLKDNISILLGQMETDKQLIEDVLALLKRLKIKTNYDDIVIMKYGPYYEANIIIYMEKNQTVEEYQRLCEKIKEAINQEVSDIKYINVQVKLNK